MKQDIYEKYLTTACFTWLLYIALLTVLIIFIGYPKVQNVESCVQGDTLGFWYGLWHGWIAMISLIASLFDNSITVYAVNNNGAWYNFGFILGASTIIDRFFKEIFSTSNQE
jgi:hypothetical protein